jgi:hypothetical protein
MFRQADAQAGMSAVFDTHMHFRTGFTTLGIVKAGVKPEKIIMIDQSPHQLAKAKKKPQLQGVTILQVRLQERRSVLSHV